MKSTWVTFRGTEYILVAIDEAFFFFFEIPKIKTMRDDCGRIFVNKQPP